MKPNTPRPLASRATLNWPTPEQLASMGLVKCATDACRTHLDPVNVHSRYCQACWRKNRDHRREQGFTNRPRIQQPDVRAIA